mmetsp:Transcript_550/g.1695  ORF Transcript_550/g.1695 Transcript_550/m.1695 type:complete len:375 (+) Transcript_550:1887-3011(+)
MRTPVMDTGNCTCILQSAENTLERRLEGAHSSRGREEGASGFRVRPEVVKRGLLLIIRKRRPPLVVARRVRPPGEVADVAQSVRPGQQAAQDPKEHVPGHGLVDRNEVLERGGPHCSDEVARHGQEDQSKDELHALRGPRGHRERVPHEFELGSGGKGIELPPEEIPAHCKYECHIDEDFVTVRQVVEHARHVGHLEGRDDHGPAGGAFLGDLGREPCELRDFSHQRDKLVEVYLLVAVRVTLADEALGHQGDFLRGDFRAGLSKPHPEDPLDVRRLDKAVVIDVEKAEDGLDALVGVGVVEGTHHFHVLLARHHPAPVLVDGVEHEGEVGLDEALERLPVHQVDLRPHEGVPLGGEVGHDLAHRRGGFSHHVS